MGKLKKIYLIFILRCSDCCKKEPGFNCVQDGSKWGYTKCTPICGDKIVVLGEQCDDGNTKSNDGCSAKCQNEPGWLCTPDGKGCSQCVPICGDKLVVGNEQCDDGNTNSNDG